MVVLRFHLPGRDRVSLPVPRSATVVDTLKLLCSQRQLDHTLFVLALPPDSAQGQPVVCHGAMSVSRLRTAEVHLIKRQGNLPRANKQSTATSEPVAASNGALEQVGAVWGLY